MQNGEHVDRCDLLFSFEVRLGFRLFGLRSCSLADGTP